MIDPADAAQLEALLARNHIELKHGLGQNFLVDREIRDRVAEASGATSSDEVLEVGAGVGTLTVALAARCKRLVAVELDRRLIGPLRSVVGPSSNVRVVEADILKYDVGAGFPSGGEIVAGNIPYHLTGALVRKFLDTPPRPKRLSLVVQKEVAERWTAATGASLSTVAVQVFAHARMGFVIPSAAFSPPPEVDSALVTLEVRDAPAVHVVDLDSFFRMVEAVFQFRRKQLGNALGMMSGLGSSVAGRRLRGLGIAPERRAQTLSLPEWEAVYRSFSR